MKNGISTSIFLFFVFHSHKNIKTMTSTIHFSFSIDIRKSKIDASSYRFHFSSWVKNGKWKIEWHHRRNFILHFMRVHKFMAVSTVMTSITITHWIGPPSLADEISRDCTSGDNHIYCLWLFTVYICKLLFLNVSRRNLYYIIGRLILQDLYKWFANPIMPEAAIVLWNSCLMLTLPSRLPFTGLDRPTSDHVEVSCKHVSTWDFVIAVSEQELGIVY